MCCHSWVRSLGYILTSWDQTHCTSFFFCWFALHDAWTSGKRHFLTTKVLVSVLQCVVTAGFDLWVTYYQAEIRPPCTSFFFADLHCTMLEHQENDIFWQLRSLCPSSSVLSQLGSISGLHITKLRSDPLHQFFFADLHCTMLEHQENDIFWQLRSLCPSSSVLSQLGYILPSWDQTRCTNFFLLICIARCLNIRKTTFFDN